MIIEKVTNISKIDADQLAWRKIAQYHNTTFTTNKIFELHKIDQKQKTNAQKQALEIKYSLTQAKEYYDAAQHVTLATRPVLLYYCAMSLALSEILLKQTGASRLAALRSDHGCHGLSLSMSSTPLPTDTLKEVLNKLSAKPQTGKDGAPKGTFEVWRRSAREYPMAGFLDQKSPTGGTRTFTALLHPDNSPPPALSKEGINLHTCLSNLPYMEDALRRWDCRLEMIRAGMQATFNLENKKTSFSLIVHPSPLDLLEKFDNLIEMHPEYINHINIQKVTQGYILDIDLIPDRHLTLPHSTCINSKDIYFTCTHNGLGEFGYIYVALHILGNFARYYPDIWMKHIESHSPLANVADDLCNHALERLPILALSELSRTYYVVDK